MAFKMIDIYRLYTCDSTDIKKTDNIQDGSILHEFDTSKNFRFNGNSWIEITDIVKNWSLSSKVLGKDGIVTVTTTSTLIAEENTKRISIMVENNGNVPVIFSFGKNASITVRNLILPPASGVRTGDGGLFEIKEWYGSIYGIVEVGTAEITVTEVQKE